MGQLVNHIQDISGFVQNKFIVMPETSKKFLLDLKKITQAGLKQAELIIVVNQAACVDLQIVGYGELLLDLNLKIDLVGVDSLVFVKGALLMTKQSKINFTVAQNHLTPSAQSSIQIRTVLLDSAQFAYQGTIFIDSHASGTIARQENKNIVLSQDVIVKSRPNIEVLNSNVQCSHGSAVGDLDHEQLVYLMSRGLDRSLATKILLNSFLELDLNFEI